MDKETQAELDRLEREIWSEDKDLSDILADDVLKDLDAILGLDAEEEISEQPVAGDAALANAAQETVYEYEDEDVYGEDEDDSDEERKDGLTVGLMITACALCVGIIGVMIYWLENFL